MQKPLSILVFLTLFILIACDSNRVYEKNVAITDSKWDYRDIKTFEVNITDTLSLHNMYINIRNQGYYKYSNCFLFITITYPTQKKSRDTVDCVLAADDGEWLGKGIGDLFANQILYYKNFRFRNSGKHVIEIEQAMRDEVLDGISDIGIRIEKAE